MRKTSLRFDSFTGETIVSCTTGHTMQAQFRCFDGEGAALVAHCYQHMGAAAAGDVYRTLYGARMDAELSKHEICRVPKVSVH